LVFSFQSGHRCLARGLEVYRYAATCTALADLALVLPDRTTGAVDYIFTCSRCGRVIWRK